MNETLGVGGGLSGLSNTLHTRFCDWLDRRKPQEEEMLRCYQDNMRIYREDDVQGTGAPKTQKSKLFIGSTRGKIRSARAKLKDALFGAGKLPFDTAPSKEELKKFADAVEDILKAQLTEAKWDKALGTGIGSLCVYGTGFMFGPFVRKKTYAVVTPATDANGLPSLSESSYEYDCPYFEHARTMDCYPDPDAEDTSDGRGVFWAARKSPEFIRGLKGLDGYSDKALERAATQKVSGTTSEGSDRAEDARQSLYRYTKEGRIWFNRYFGLVNRDELDEWRKSFEPNGTEEKSDETEPVAEESGEHVPEDEVEAIIIIAGGYVVKAEENPYRQKRRPVYRCVYEEVEHEMWGVGIAKNNDPHQRVTNAGFRLFVEGKAYAGTPMLDIAPDQYEVKEDFKVFPGKRFMSKPGLSVEQRKTGIIPIVIPDVTNGWEKVIAMSEQFSDDDTGVTKYTQGTDAPHLNDTATGISMIMSASSLPLKEVLEHIDDLGTEEQIDALIDWNLDHLEPETVRVLVGEQQAQIWTAIKQYGKTNFMEWFATGSKSFMAKEVLMQHLQGFLQITAGNPLLAQRVDLSELLRQVWTAGQVGGEESPVYDDETLQRNQQQAQMANPQVQQMMQEAQQQIQAAHAQAGQAMQRAQQMESAASAAGEVHKANIDTANLDLKRQQLAIEAHRAESDRLRAQAEALSKGATPAEGGNIVPIAPALDALANGLLQIGTQMQQSMEALGQHIHQVAQLAAAPRRAHLVRDPQTGELHAVSQVATLQ